MKQIITIGAALLLLNAGSAQAQNSIEQVLRNIETNNKDGGRDLVRKLDAFKFKLPGEGVLSGQRHVDADLDGIFRFGGGGEPHAQSHTGKRAQKSAEFHASILQL